MVQLKKFIDKRGYKIKHVEILNIQIHQTLIVTLIRVSPNYPEINKQKQTKTMTQQNKLIIYV